MKVKDLKKLINELDEDMEIFIDYGDNQYDDVKVEFMCFDEVINTGEDCYFLQPSGTNIREFEEL